MAKQRKKPVKIKEKKKRPINGIVRALVNGALMLVDSFLVNKIPDERIKQLTLLATDRVRATVRVLSDKDLHDGPQVARVWLDMVNDPTFLGNIEKLLKEQTGKIKNPQLQQFIDTLIVPIFDTVTSFTDDIHPNGLQIAEVWKEFFLNHNNVLAILNLFDPKQQATQELEAAARFISSTLHQILEQIKHSNE